MGAQNLPHLPGLITNQLAMTKGNRIGGERISVNNDAAVERVFQSSRSAVMRRNCFTPSVSTGQLVGRTGLVEELEDVPAIDGFDGGFLVGVAGEHDAHGVREISGGRY